MPNGSIYAIISSMSKMIDFDSITLIPAYSDIESRSEVDISSKLNSILTSIPIINANMLAICTPEMMDVAVKNNTVCSYHRFFESQDLRKKCLKSLDIDKKLLFVSIGTKKEEYEFADYLSDNGFNRIIIDVNHGHHKMVGKICEHIKTKHPDMFIMAGNVSSVEGVSFLKNCGADCAKIGNSFGFSCTTIKQTGFGVHPLHTAKEYREQTNDWDYLLCLDGGIRDVSDIAKCMIWGNVVMVGKMLAGCDESYGRVILTGSLSDNSYREMKEYFGNASIRTKQVINEENHIRHIEGTVKLVPKIGPMQNLLNSISDGLQSAYSFVGARNLDEFQREAIKHILYVK